MKRLLVVSLTIVTGLLLAGGPVQGQRGPEDRPREGNLKVGDPAPDFTLKTLDGKSEVKLSSHRGQRPVVLIFGSYT